jgi:hypothetical protein
VKEVATLLNAVRETAKQLRRGSTAKQDDRESNSGRSKDGRDRSPQNDA